MKKREESSNTSSGILDIDGDSSASFQQAFLTGYCNVMHTQKLSILSGILIISDHEKHLDNFICCSLCCSN